MRIEQIPIALNPPVRHDADKIDQVARQLEGQFAQLLIKSMRDASFGDALFPGENQLFHEMYDQQLAKMLTNGKGLGIAAMIARQLGHVETPEKFVEHNVSRSEITPVSHAHPPPQPIPESHTPESFVTQIWHHARQAARELGVNVRALIAQAALETNWGKHGLRRDDNGDSAHNLFGIKATGWQGERATTRTHEYRNGVRQSERAAFRAYSSVAESFTDYVKLLKQNPRYQNALHAGDNVRGFASALQKAGYATDPDYADKISAIANGPILQRVLAKIM